MEMSSNHNTSESGQTDSSGRTSLVFSIRGPIPIQLGKLNSRDVQRMEQI